MTSGALVGIDGYPKGWIAAVLADQQISWHTCGIHELKATVRSCSIVAIDIPLKLVATGWRDCDRQTKAALGAHHSRVFMIPPRPVLELGLQAPNESTQALSIALTGSGVSRQALALSERILAANALLPDKRLHEVHPELVFAALDGGVVPPPKKSARGVGTRIRILDPWLTTLGTSCALLMKNCPPDVPVDDALDSLAALAGALRIDHGIAQRWPAKGRGPTIWA
ncbi:MAG: DUF429 domain-containing protein [Actinomycetota bacterium]|nr:DUF429 domain-containing protein [Actinomycetota bacterium]MDP2289375.1 DUF429 domain-containing protein [Actinomycetota bacterium]